MADTVTPHFGLTKPENDGSDDTWGLKTNADWDIVDAAMYANQVAAAAAQASGTAALARVPHFQQFVAGGSFTIPAGTVVGTVFDFEVIAAGGGGGGAASDGSGQPSGAGGGAGAGVRAQFSGFTAAQVVTIAIGAAGTAGANTGGTGGTGGTSSLTYAAVAVVSCTGGAGGVGAGAGVYTSAAGGAPGAATVSVGASGLTLVQQMPFLAEKGANTIGIASAPVVGRGGSGTFGSGGGAGIGASAGVAGGGYGAGGGGAIGGSGANIGGVGSAGVVNVRWFL